MKFQKITYKQQEKAQNSKKSSALFFILPRIIHQIANSLGFRKYILYVLRNLVCSVLYGHWSDIAKCFLRILYCRIS